MAKDSQKLHLHLDAKKKRITYVAAVAALCALCYILGGRHGGAPPISTPQEISSKLGCNTDDDSSAAAAAMQLDFASHHYLQLNTSYDSGESFPACDFKYSEYTPCEDQERSKKFNRTQLKYRERHCPAATDRLRCLIPAPPNYKSPFKWPQSRDYAWYNNIPHKELSIEKAVQNWIQVEGERFRFPGGGTMFPRGADAYIDDINALIPLTDGTIRTAVDTGCGVASWGAYLLKRDIIAMSFAPRDTHEAQVWFALERGVPAMIGILGSRRLPYPARSFDMAHCSRCLIPWFDYDGLYLIEVDRILRPGGYWILSGPPIRWKKYWKGWERTPEDLKKEQDSIEEVAKKLCWKKVVEKGDLAIWQKPINHVECRKTKGTIPICATSDNADEAWYKDMEVCITPLPQASKASEVAGGALKKWPDRAFAVPPRISSGSIPGVNAAKFQDDNELWKKRVAYYKNLIYQLPQGAYRNVMDMNANLGGFAAAMLDYPVWVMNVVPVHAKPNTLGVIYERGLIGAYQDWCEAFSTYPRTYDLIHADNVFTMYQDKCDIADILLEMDRILRPEGAVLFRDTVEVLQKVKSIADRMRWESKIHDHEDGPLNPEKILVAKKTYWTAEPQKGQSQTTSSVEGLPLSCGERSHIVQKVQLSFHNKPFSKLDSSASSTIIEANSNKGETVKQA
ncbi:probable methyltransferase PMT17 [Andrographis paniculata]|uniref:probable methyltransferase PMT17 n=1 Tax=Andrographis paniculata TaxID=175694 RepID=UPI0021E873A3|nr:probable methyltransferase PMT17 [Andrographis paniculata]